MLRVLLLVCVCSLFPSKARLEDASNLQEERSIEQKIKNLDERLKELRLEQVEEEVKSQGLMIGDWEAYGKELEVIRKQEGEEDRIQNEIRELKRQKRNLSSQEPKKN